MAGKTPIARVLYLVQFPFNDRDYERFGLDTLSGHGFEVEVWDLTALIQPEILGSVHTTLTAQNVPLRVVSDRRIAIDAIHGLDGRTFVVAHLGYTPESWFVYRALARTPARYGLVASNAMPLVKSSSSPRLAWSKLVHMTPGGVLRSIFHRIPAWATRLRPADVVFVSTDTGLKGCQPIGAATVRLPVHAFDYDAFVRARRAPFVHQTPYGVFLDDFLPNHPDFIAAGGAPVEADVYYPRLRKFFDQIEDASGIEVIVAAHPRSNYESACFGERMVIQRRTADLVCGSQFVMTHTSQSFGIAALARKPAVFLTMSALDRATTPVGREFGERIRAMAAAVGKRPHSIDGDTPFDFADEMRVDQGKYTEYCHRYIKHPGSPDLPYWEIVSLFLKELR